MLPILILKVLSVVVGLNVSVFTINWQTWPFLFPHDSHCFVLFYFLRDISPNTYVTEAVGFSDLSMILVNLWKA